ncbi:MAG: Lrp/AsnC family transcriptional regulator [Methanomicrobiaceae archaeon]|nr:Lrp/AsnC family transcriptional regulator [Methanomicrobiaceae archaeon]
MDEKDRLLLTLLDQNSRLPSRELAELVDLDEQDVNERIRLMEGTGIIQQYTAVIDWEKAGDGEVAVILELKVSPERDFGYDKVAERIARFRQVRSVRLVSGIYDLELVVTGRNIHEVARFVSEQIAPMDHIRETATVLIMKTYKENGHIFYEKEEGERLPLSI